MKTTTAFVWTVFGVLLGAVGAPAAMLGAAEAFDPRYGGVVAAVGVQLLLLAVATVLIGSPLLAVSHDRMSRAQAVLVLVLGIAGWAVTMALTGLDSVAAFGFQTAVLGVLGGVLALLVLLGSPTGPHREIAPAQAPRKTR